MDHKGPEHPYDEVECPECGVFWQQGEIQPETVRNNCPGCGYDLRSGTGGRPYRGQPSEINSEMTERNTPLDGASKDRGGNPLNEGILAKSIIEEAKEEADQVTDPTEPAGLGETHPMKDNTWKPGDRLDRGQGRDEILGSKNNEDEIWDEIVDDFEHVKKPEEDSTGKVAAASWLENDGLDSNVPADHLGWDVVDVVEPNREVLEAQNKYSMPIPNGITDVLHNALVELNAWVENPEENGKLRPYKEYWSVIRPKINESSTIQIGVEDPHMADIINHIARTGDESTLDKTASMEKQSWGMALRAAPMVLGRLGIGAAEGGGIGNAMGTALNVGKAANMLGMGGGDDGSSSGGQDASAQQGQMSAPPSEFGVTGTGM
jgi:hypothetical protein